MWFSGSADKGCATVRDRYGRQPPSTCRLLAAEVFRLTAKRTLIDTTMSRRTACSSSSSKNRPGFTYIRMVTDIVRPFYGVVHMPFPVIFMGITQRNGNTTLRRNGMGTGRKTLESSAQVWPLWEICSAARIPAPPAPITTASNSLTGNFITHPPQRIHKSRKPPVQRQSPVAASGARPAV